MANTEKIVVQVVVQGEKDLQRLEKRTGTTTKSFGKNDCWNFRGCYCF